MIVLDASAAIELIMQRPCGGLIARQLRETDAVWVPDLFFSEVANALWKLTAFAGLEEKTGSLLLRLTLALPDHVEDSSELVESAFQLAGQLRRPVYDFLYLRLAETKQATLVTMDHKLASTCRDLKVRAYLPST
ncbi:MAG TPA: type II toxin-antitoxin system VapC family toxin [Acidobacteriota bacterium]|nr:type II toxin-antitoxin system VapC family toxin [Acidobacteriota bacterium]